MEWNKARIRTICENPNEGNNCKILGKMLVALYAKQTEGEKVAGCTAEQNKQGFNSIDANFLSSVAESVKKWGSLTNKQSLYVGKKLKKYAGQLEEIAKINLQTKKDAKKEKTIVNLPQEEAFAREFLLGLRPTPFV
jgi:hypothetical protein